MKAKNYTKHIAIAILILTLASPIFTELAAGFIKGQSSGGADYVVLEGVAGNDYYDSVQYSYKVNEWAYQHGLYGMLTPAYEYYDAGKSLRVGFTEYGEFATPAHAGLAYGKNAAEWANTESWAPNQIPIKDWIQGWVLYVNYTRQTIRRCIEAWALYSDFVTNEGGRNVYSWKGQYMPDDVNAQLTQGYLNTTGVKVLYDSARLVVVRASVTIHDNKYNEDFAMITFTIVYNKDTKYAIVYKDYKTLLNPKDLDEIVDFAFSERYELDMVNKVNSENSAYIHYYHNYASTVYQHPLTGDKTYDVLQAFDPAKQYVFFGGYWPNATEYSVYSTLVPNLPEGKTNVLPVGTAIPDIPDPSPGEPNTPWVVVQWRYNNTYYPSMLHWLAKKGGGIDPDTGKSVDNKREIRFVEVIGMTDYNLDPYNARDMKVDQLNRIDAEVLYLLDRQVFNPEDLTTVTTVETKNQPFMWVGLGQSSATTDSAGAGMVSQLAQPFYYAPFMLFDRNDTAFPWTAPVITMKGSIPYGLNEYGGNYYEQFSNSGKATGTDTTLYKRTTLKGFAFGLYDDDPYTWPPQPIAGGWSYYDNYWYPSKDPLTERWAYNATTDVWVPDQYDDVNYDPNGIISLGGMKANGLTRYFNDFGYAISREGSSAYALVNGNTVTGTAPTSDFAQNTFDYFPISTWNSTTSTFGYKDGYAVISLVRDINGTRGLAIYGWDGRDSYWAAAWASQYLGMAETVHQWIPPGTVSLILKINYDRGALEPTGFTVVRALGTITEFGWNAFTEDPAHGYDKNLYWTAYWDHLYYLPTYPRWAQGEGFLNVWWFAKLYTESSALVEFDS